MYTCTQTIDSQRCYGCHIFFHIISVKRIYQVNCTFTSTLQSSIPFLFSHHTSQWHFRKQINLSLARQKKDQNIGANASSHSAFVKFIQKKDLRSCEIHTHAVKRISEMKPSVHFYSVSYRYPHFISTLEIFHCKNDFFFISLRLISEPT